MKNCLTVAGSDCSGGAGVQADLGTFWALGCYGMSVITSVVAENTAQVLAAHSVPRDIVSAQLRAVFTDIRVDAVKLGMLPNAECMEAVANALREYRPSIVVCDPVLHASAGAALMDGGALGTFMREIAPLCTLITPNIPEAQALSGLSVSTHDDMRAAALAIHKLGARAVLVKGGHLAGAALDVLYDGERFYEYTHERVNTRATHGTGCTLSSAAAAFMAQGEPLAQAVRSAKEYLTGAIMHGLNIGMGQQPFDRFYRLFTERT